jgi:two-component system chemotaxis sensor kinase CheA
LVHVVRNAVDHGIEAPSEREAEGKDRSGRLRLATRRVGAGYRVEVEDDGRGIDWQAIRARCEEWGYPHATHADLLRALLSPDFSTRAHVTDTSGRGMGLAALASAVSELGGCVDVSSELGHGARWVLTFPSLEAPPLQPK